MPPPSESPLSGRHGLHIVAGRRYVVSFVSVVESRRSGGIVRRSDMAGRRLTITVAACAGLVLPWLALAAPAGAAPAG